MKIRASAVLLFLVSGIGFEVEEKKEKPQDYHVGLSITGDVLEVKIGPKEGEVNVLQELKLTKDYPPTKMDAFNYCNHNSHLFEWSGNEKLPQFPILIVVHQELVWEGRGAEKNDLWEKRKIIYFHYFMINPDNGDVVKASKGTFDYEFPRVPPPPAPAKNA